MSPLMYSLADDVLTYESEVITFVPVKEAILLPTSPKMTPQSEVKKKAVQSTKSDIKELISKHFTGEDAKVAYAIIKAESSGNPRAVGYNCFYTKDGTVHEERVKGAISTFCKQGHEKYSWSIDCGKIQRNFPGKRECPEYAFDPEWSIAEMKKLHNERGWQPWTTYTSGRYMAFME